MTKIDHMTEEQKLAYAKERQKLYDEEITKITMAVAESMARMIKEMINDGVPNDAVVQMMGNNCRVILADMARFMLVFLFNPKPDEVSKQKIITELVGRSLRTAADEFDKAHKVQPEHATAQ